MKKLLTILLVIPALALAMLVASSCTKEGPAGPAGENGINGTNGTDATSTCGECHNSGEAFLAIELQYNMSGHANNGNYDRNTTSCAPCHTSMGFREVIETGANETAATINNPTPPNCYTCHKVHETYTASDWELRYTDPVTYLQGGATFDYGVSNLCAKCHQSREASPYPGAAGGTIVFDDDVSYRWGPHHGPQSNLFAGVAKSGAYEVSGDAAYTNSWHTDNFEDACNTCHMADPPYGDHWGGHTFAMGSLNDNGCLECHDDAEDKVEAAQMVIEVLLADLKVLLENQGIMDTVDHPGYLNVPGTYSNELAGAFYNYKLLEEDRSIGIHNYKYTKALLENSINAID